MKKYLFVLAIIALPLSAEAQVRFEVGLDSAVNTGERPGAIFGLRTERPGLVNIENFASFDTSHKLLGFDGSRKLVAGWKATDAFLVRVGGRYGVVGGTTLKYRNGGDWHKQTVWAALGASIRGKGQEMRFLYYHPVYESYPNDVHQAIVEFRVRKPGSRVGLVLEEALVSYHDYTGRPRRYGFGQTANLALFFH